MLTDLQVQALLQGEGTALWFLNSLTTIKATTESTGGAFSLVQQEAPAGFGTPYHLHHVEDEAFWVLEGHCTFFSQGQRIEAGPGAYLFLPRGLPHGFRVSDAGPAKLLILAMPGDGFMGFLREMGRPALERRLPEPTEQDMGKMVVLCAKYQMEVLGPLPG